MMGWIARLGFVAAGLFLIRAAVSQMRAGRFVFDNASYHQQTFAADGIGVGVVLMVLAFLPSREWMYERIKTKRTVRVKKEKNLKTLD